MESIERIAPPPQLDLAATDGFIVTMREFLAKFHRIQESFGEIE